MRTERGGLPDSKKKGKAFRSKPMSSKTKKKGKEGVPALVVRAGKKSYQQEGKDSIGAGENEKGHRKGVPIIASSMDYL